MRPEDPSEAAHLIAIADATALQRTLGEGDQPVNSRHHQAVRDVGAGLIVSARAPDGIVEAIERPDRRFAVGVQWHPEDQVRRYPVQMRLFEAFRDSL